eukprot:365443-Chlamydomonas_euryale.AAC.13
MQCLKVPSTIIARVGARLDPRTCSPPFPCPAMLARQSKRTHAAHIAARKAHSHELPPQRHIHRHRSCPAAGAVGGCDQEAAGVVTKAKWGFVTEV